MNDIRTYMIWPGGATYALVKYDGDENYTDIILKEPDGKIDQISSKKVLEIVEAYKKSINKIEKLNSEITKELSNDVELTCDDKNKY